jgi:hypothetical protein
MDILITDVTEMHAGNYCVAGWNATDRQMIRQDISSRLMASNLVGGLFEGESNHVVDVRLDVLPRNRVRSTHLSNASYSSSRIKRGMPLWQP